jgi:hypothetical protein
VGREWLRNGTMPYRDAFEQKTPGIFFVNALAITLFGEQMSSIRVLELAGVVVLGIACSRLATSMGDPVRPGSAAHPSWQPPSRTLVSSTCVRGDAHQVRASRCARWWIAKVASRAAVTASRTRGSRSINTRAPRHRGNAGAEQRVESCEMPSSARVDLQWP